MLPDQATPLLDRYLFSTFKAAFGGRVRFIVSGGAPLSSHVEEYLATTLCTPVFQVGRLVAGGNPYRLFLTPRSSHTWNWSGRGIQTI